MSTTVTYKGSTLTTVDNQTRTLKTAGKYMEGDVILTDVSSSGGYVTQDQDGFIVLPPDGGGSPSVGGLEYETGTWTPSEDTTRGTVSFSNTHTLPPVMIMMTDTTQTSCEANSNLGFSYLDHYRQAGHGLPYGGIVRYGDAEYMYSTTNNGTSSSAQIFTTSSDSPSDTIKTSAGYWAKANEFYPSSGSDSRYWRAGRTYKWIAVWAPTT